VYFVVGKAAIGLKRFTPSCDMHTTPNHLISVENNGLLSADLRDSYKNYQKDVTVRIIYCSMTTLHVSSDIFAHHQENLKYNYSV